MTDHRQIEMADLMVIQNQEEIESNVESEIKESASIKTEETSPSCEENCEEIQKKAKKTYKNRKISETSSPGSDVSVAVVSSPYQNTSRYGRTRKPKITEDYYNIEDIFGPYERITCNMRKRSSQKLELSPCKSSESINLEEVKPIDLNSVLSINIPDESSLEISKVIKIVSNNSSVDFSPKSPTFSSKTVKMYSNKNKKHKEFKFLNGLKEDSDDISEYNVTEANDSDNLFKSVHLFSEESFSSVSSVNYSENRTKSRKKCSLSENDKTIDDIKQLLEESPKNKKLNKLQKDLNITEFTKGRLRSSVHEGELEIKTEIKEEDVDIKQFKQDYLKLENGKIKIEGSSGYMPEVGSLAWSRVGNFPFWPSIVTIEPGTSRHARKTMFGRRNVECYHVHFFGDNGRRSWVLGSHIFPFNRRSDLEIMAQSVSKDSKPKDPKHLSAFIINPNKLKKWETAVTEAESITDFEPEVRIEKFFEMVNPKKKLKKIFQTSNKYDLSLKYKKKKLKNNYYKKSKILKQKKIKIDFKIEEEDIPKNNKNLELTSNSEISETKKKPKSEDIKQIPISDDVLSECEFPSEIKQEIENSPSPEREISQFQRQKRINLFRGITKERVCQICGKNKHVYKCKGNCFGLYHIECDRKVRNRISARLFPEKMSITSSTGSSEDEDTIESRKVEESNDIKKINKMKEINEILTELLENVFETIKGETINDDVEQENEISKNEVNEGREFTEKMSQHNGEIVENDVSDDNEQKNEDLNDETKKSEELDHKNEDIEDSNKNNTIPDEQNIVNVVEKITETTEINDENKNEEIDDKTEETVEIHSESNENDEPEESENRNDKSEDINADNTGTSNESEKDEVIKDKNKKVARSLSLAEQIDLKMQEVMQNLITETKYTDSTTDEGSENEEDIRKIQTDNQIISKEIREVQIGIRKTPKSDEKSKQKVKIIKHVTADGIFDIIKEDDPINEDYSSFKCAYCSLGTQPPCFICNKEVSKLGETKRHKCMTAQCGKYYHSKCLNDWPQTKWNVASKSKKIDNETLNCPYHNCHTCVSDDPRGPLSRFTKEKLIKCIRCPTTYHINNFCIPAGTEILSNYQLICPKHLKENKKAANKLKIMPHVNASWCFICSVGGSLICCETCPSSFHVECLKLVPPEGRYICEECESGRLPLYDEIVWVKLGSYRWWPAKILYPADIPPNVACIPHANGEFVVRFFGSHDHYWVNRGRVFLFQEGDTGHSSGKKSTVDGLFTKAIKEATKAHKKFLEERANRAAEAKNGMRPPSYVKIKVNRPVGNVRTSDADTSNTTPCDCDPNWEFPCGPDSDCLNRILMTECNPMVCAAGSRCCNQSFEKRLYAPVAPFKTNARGWGLKTLAPVNKGSFVIEYVGEVIDEVEYRRRMKLKHEQKDENYYFLTIDKDRMIDAGPKGNVARFMNHSCSPNCETQKWTVNGDTRVGLFAIMDISVGAELTFNYNLECIGEEKKECRCGAPNCSGFIGVKAKQDEVIKKRKSITLKSRKKKSAAQEIKLAEVITCFICGEPDAIQPCDREACNKFYHLHCVNLENFQEGKWYCPWHSCNICTKRTTRSCYMCINSYCPIHSEGNIRYDRLKGFVCTVHDIKEDEIKEEVKDTTSGEQKETGKMKKKKQSRQIVSEIRSSFDSSKNSEESTEKSETESIVKEDFDENSTKSFKNSAEDEEELEQEIKKENLNKQEENDSIKDEKVLEDYSQEKKENQDDEENINKKQKINSKKLRKSNTVEYIPDKQENLEESKRESKLDEENIQPAVELVENRIESIKNGIRSDTLKPSQQEETKIVTKNETETIDNENVSKNGENSSNILKKRKLRLSLKLNYELSNSSQEEISEDEKPLVKYKRRKINEQEINENERLVQTVDEVKGSTKQNSFVKTKTKILRSDSVTKKCASVDNILNNKSPQFKNVKRNLSSTDLDSSTASDDDFVTSPKNIIKKENINKKLKMTTSESEHSDSDVQKVPKQLRRSVAGIKSKETTKKTPSKFKNTKEETSKSKLAKDITKEDKKSLNTSVDSLKTPVNITKLKKFSLSLRKSETSTPEDSSNVPPDLSKYGSGIRKRMLNLKQYKNLSIYDLPIKNIAEFSPNKTVKKKEKPAPTRKSLRNVKIDENVQEQVKENIKEEVQENVGEEQSKMEVQDDEKPESKVQKDVDISQTNENTEVIVKRKRGRPRKYPLPVNLDKVNAEIKSETNSTVEIKEEMIADVIVEPEVTETVVQTETVETPSSNIDSIPVAVVKRPKGRPRKQKPDTVNEYIKQKLNNESIPKNRYENHVNEVKLTSNVPARHLRVVLRKSSEIDSKNDNKFLKMQNDIERDLPIRKRSKLRYEAQL